MAVYKPKYRDKKTGEVVESAVWWYEFTFAGKRVRDSAKTTRKTIAQEAEKGRRLELERALAGLPTEDRGIRINRVGEMVSAYLVNYPINHRPKSVIFARQRLAHVTRLLGGLLLPDLTEERVREYIRARIGEDAGGRTVNMELGELSRAVGHKWSALWPKVRKLEEGHGVGRALSGDEESRLLSAAAGDESPNRNPSLYPYLCIALATGMRAGEVASLRWLNVDLDSSVLTVGRSKTAAGAGRQIPINPDLRAAIEAHASWYTRKLGKIRPEWYVFPGRSGRPKGGTLRPLDPMKPVGDITTAWDTLRERCGVQCRLHDLRHTAATKMAEAGAPESTMLAIMGHMSRAMLERYSHIRMVAKRDAVKSLALPKAGPKLVENSVEVPKESPKVMQKRRNAKRETKAVNS
jgi:integrase